MITYLQSIVLGLIQGLTELFPVSSLGHSIIIPSLLHWNIAQNGNYFLLFLVATHLATALVLIGFFFDDWKKIIRAIFRSIKHGRINNDDTHEKVGWLLIVATIPAVILGFLLEKKITALILAPDIVAVFLIANGIVLLLVEQYAKKRSVPKVSQDDARIAKLSWAGSIKIGLVQSIALIPGFSRTGVALGGGLVNGLSHEDAARFSFLLATPIILAAAIFKLPELRHGHYAIGPIVVGFITAGIAAYVSVRFLANYFKTKTLTPFAWYCIGIGVLALVLLV